MLPEENQKALAVAFKRASVANSKIKEFAITPKMSKAATDKLIIKQAKEKAKVEGKDWKQFVEGQRYYIESLINFSGLKPEEKLDYEYNKAFADVASKEEMIAALSA